MNKIKIKDIMYSIFTIFNATIINFWSNFPFVKCNCVDRVYKLGFMTFCLLLFSFSCLIYRIFGLSFDFEWSTNESKLITWNNGSVNNGSASQLLLSQLQIVQKTVLVQKLTLPLSYIVD